MDPGGSEIERGKKEEKKTCCLNVRHKPNPLVSEIHEIISVAEHTPLQYGQQRLLGHNRNRKRM